MAKIIVTLKDDDGKQVKSFSESGSAREMKDMYRDFLQSTMQVSPPRKIADFPCAEVQITEPEPCVLGSNLEVTILKDRRNPENNGKVIKVPGGVVDPDYFSPTVVEKDVPEEPEYKKPKLMTMNPDQKGLRAMKCPHCGKIAFTIGHGDEDYECFFCHEVYPVPELVRAIWGCECGREGKLWVEHGKIDEVKCGTCDQPIDLFFHEKKGVYLSPSKF